MREVNQRELERLAKYAASAAGLAARAVKRAPNETDPDLPAVFVGGRRLQLVRCQGEGMKPATSWLLDGVNYYDGLGEAIAETVSAEAYTRAEAALEEAGITEND